MSKIVYSNFFLKELSMVSSMIEDEDQGIVNLSAFNSVRRYSQEPKKERLSDYSFFVTNPSESFITSFLVE